MEGTYFVIKDHLGSTRVVLNAANGEPVNYFDFTPYGNTMRVGGGVGVKYQFTGQEYDDELGLHNFRARLYDSDIGIFYSTDPAGQGFAPFAYAGNNPVIYVDKDGRWFIIDDLIVSAVSFVTGYISHGLTTGNWGWDAIKSGGISAGVAWLAYYTGGAASGFLFEEGSFGYAMTASIVGGTVGGAGGSIANQLAFNGKVDWNLVGRSTVSGFGGGLIGGAAGYYLTGDPVLTSMIGGAVSGGIGGSYEGQFLQGAFMGSWWGGFSGALTAKAYEEYGRYLTDKYFGADSYGTNVECGGLGSCHDFRTEFMKRSGWDVYAEFEGYDVIRFDTPELRSLGLNKGDIISGISHSGIPLGRNMYGQHFILSKFNVGLPVLVKTGTYLNQVHTDVGLGTYYFIRGR